MIDKLEYLIALASERHFGRAAERLGITQPTLSAGIRQLESQLGVMLVIRGSRYQGLSEEGERVLSWARRITGDARTMREELASVRGGLAGRLRIGAIPTTLAVVARLTTPLMERHANVTFEVTSHTAADIVAGVENFEIDVALTYLDDDRLRRLKTLPLYAERYCLVTVRGAPLSDRASVTWKEAAGVPLCLLSTTMQNRRILDRHLGAEGDRVRAVMESNSMIALLSHSRTAGIATILPRRSAAMLGLADPMVAIPITSPEVSYRIGLVSAAREPRAPVVEAFWTSAATIALQS